jgi:hypothetical protein
MLHRREVMRRSPFEKGGNRGLECDFAAGRVWTDSTNSATPD